MTYGQRPASDYRQQPRWTDEAAMQRADELGCTVEFSDDYTLQLDIDSDEAYAYFHEQFAMARELIPGFFYPDPWVKRSKSGNRHVTIVLDFATDLATRILLQAMLGSDRKRELLAFVGLQNGQNNPVLFFRPKEKANVS